MIFGAALLGLIAGSFINALVFSLKSGKSLFRRSVCQHCLKKLKAYDMIPIVSFFVLKRKCRYCSKKIAWQYPLVELATAALFILLYPNAASWQAFFAEAVLLTVLVALVVYDLRYYLLPEKLLWFAIIFGFLAKLYLGFELTDLLLGGIILLFFFGFQYFVSKGRWLGQGDIYLAVFVGLSLGWQKAIAAVFLSYACGAVIGLVLLLLKKKNFQSKIPFAPFLVFGYIMSLFFGNRLISFFIGL